MSDQDRKLIEWQEKYKDYRHSDRLAGEIGIFVLKVLMAINGAALISLMAAYPNIKGGVALAVPLAGKWFLYGLVLSVVASFLAYIYQSVIAAADMHDLHKVSGQDAPFVWARTTAGVLIIFVIGIGIAAFILFVLGGLEMLNAFEGVAIP